MTPGRWARVREVFEAALDRHGPARAQLLAEACDGDAVLRDEVASLLDAHDHAGSFLERRSRDGSATAADCPPARRPGDCLGPYRRALAYIMREADHYGVYVQDLRGGGARSLLAALEPDLQAESFAISPDGSSVTVSFREERHDLMLAEGIEALARPGR